MKRPDITTPGKLFESSARYKAPIFQRYYVWGKDEWEALVEDVETIDAKIGQFLGAVVLKDLGRTAGPSSPSTYLIIDGQQRLTTIYLFLLALAERSKSVGEDQMAEYIWKNYLAETKSPQYAGWPKLVPTLQDRHTFYAILAEALPDVHWNTSADPEDKKPRVSKKLLDQWKRIRKYVFSATGEDAFSQHDHGEFITAIQDHLRLIDITLEDDDDANATFSRLNAKGVPLDLADLVRNEVFSKFDAKDADKADRFYNKEWHPFEKLMGEADLSAFFPVYAYVAFKGKITKAASFAALQRKWTKSTPAQVLSELEKYAPYFASLSEFKKHPGLKGELNHYLELFSRMPRTRVTWPFLLELFRGAAEGRLSVPHAVRSLKIVEAFLVRRALVGREPTGLHAVFKVLWEKTKGDPKQVLEKIVTRTVQVPDDAELSAYLKKERSDTRAILPFVLQEYERDLIRKKKFDPLTETVATIEHILPRNLSSSWSKVVSSAEHERCIGLLGNLLPLSSSQNKSLQDQTWAEKKKRFKGSNFKTAQSISKKAEWNASEIDTRTKQMIAWVRGRWPELDTI